MIPHPKPRGFWDYALFALLMSGILMCLFWSEIGHGIGWADAALALAAAVLCALAIILARRNERATWIGRPSSWKANLLVALGSFLFVIGALYADRYILHRMDVTASQIHRDVALGIALSIAASLSFRNRHTARPQLP